MIIWEILFSYFCVKCATFVLLSHKIILLNLSHWDGYDSKLSTILKLDSFNNFANGVNKTNAVLNHFQLLWILYYNCYFHN